MSENATPIRECDAALDYLYGMLSGEAKTRFETHLAGCARCQAELEGFGRVREVARAALPTVEPSERLGAGLHQQLLHAAAQRKPRGKVIPFMRRVLTHPAYAAAAGILIVGGAIGVQWTRGRLLMPAPEAPAPVVAAAPATPPAQAEAPAAEPAAPPKAMADKRAQRQGQPELKLAGDQDKSGISPVEKQAEQNGRASATNMAPGVRPKKELVDALGEGAAADSATSERARKVASQVAKDDGSLDGLFGSGVKGGASMNGIGSGASAGGAGLGKVSAAPAKPAPAPRQAIAPAEMPAASAAPAPPPAPNKKAAGPSQTYGDAEPEAKPAAPRRDEAERRAAVTEEAQAHARGGADDGTPATAGFAKSANADLEQRREGNKNIDPVANERGRAATLAQAGRCEEASAIYESLEKRSPEQLTSQDRLTYARCLRTLGRLDPAQNELDQLRSNKSRGAKLPAAALSAEQNAIDMQRKRQAAADAQSTGETQTQSKAKKAVKSARPTDAGQAPAGANVNKAY